MGLTLLSTLVVIGVLVFVHELGHFLAAKWAGIYVHRFSLGLGAPIRWLSFKRGETEYSVSWIPLGGYVKMASELEGPSSLEGGTEAGVVVPPERLFESKPVWVRMIVILAGVAMNGLFAWLVFSGLLYGKGLPVLPITTVAGVDATTLPAGAEALAALGMGDRISAVNGQAVASWQDLTKVWRAAADDSLRLGLADGRTVAVPALAPEARDSAIGSIRPYLPPVIADVLPGRAGARAGLAAGDTILSLDGQPVVEWRDMVSWLDGAADREIDVQVGRPGGRETIRATPAGEEQADSAGNKRTVGRLGIAGPLIPDARVPIGLGPALSEGARRTAFVATQIVNMVHGMFAGRVSTREIGGPIAIGMAAGESARRGAEDFLVFMAAISVNLGVLNLLPIPILDGGQFLFLLAEGVTRRPVRGRVRDWLTMAGLIAIVMLMILAFSNDIRRALGF
ncbi:MAG: RIP metalloprotease RseP [Gemmatimonadales bacterium]